MTTQIPDIVIYQGRSFNLSGADVGLRFDPNEHGIKPQMISTGCWLGYYCAYEVSEEALYLKRVYVGLGNEDQQAVTSGGGPRLFDVLPVYDEQHSCYVYNIMQKVSYTGTLLIGADPCRFGGEMGSMLYDYKEAHELVFEQGALTSSQDISASMAETRQRMEQAGATGIAGMMSLFPPLVPPEDKDQQTQ